MAVWNDDIDLAAQGASWRSSLCASMAKERKAVIVTEVDDGYKIVACNAAWNDLCGFSPEDALGKSPKILQGARTDSAKAKAYTCSVLDSTLHGDNAGFAAWQSACTTKLVNYTRKGRAFVHCLRTTRVRDEDTGQEYFYTESHEETDETIAQAMLRRVGIVKTGELSTVQVRDAFIFLAGLAAFLAPALYPTLRIMSAAASQAVEPPPVETAPSATFARYVSYVMPPRPSFGADLRGYDPLLDNFPIMGFAP